ncbi:MAG: DUF1292 domain-containing protein [Lachnospiraceae bacterium]
MEKVWFHDSENGEDVEFYVVEQTKINGVTYLLVSVEEDGDSDAFIMKDISEEQEEEAILEMVEDDQELEVVSKIFEEILEDVDITM